LTNLLFSTVGSGVLEAFSLLPTQFLAHFKGFWPSNLTNIGVQSKFTSKKYIITQRCIEINYSGHSQIIPLSPWNILRVEEILGDVTQLEPPDNYFRSHITPLDELILIVQ
jgi:hypothetical protein